MQGTTKDTEPTAPGPTTPGPTAPGPTTPGPMGSRGTAGNNGAAAPGGKGARGKLLAAIVAGALLMAAAKLLPIAAWIEASRATLDGLGPWGPPAFGAVYVVAALCFVPGAVITLAAGSFFGAFVGTAVVSVASTTAAALAFLLARTMLRARVEGWARARPRFAALDAAIRSEGWRVVGLLRLSPAMPFSLGNYLFGLTPVRFGPYLLVSWLAMLPGTFLYVSIGAAGADAATGALDLGRSTLLGGGLLATIAVSVLLGRAAKRRLAEFKATKEPEPEPERASLHAARPPQ
ncbi:MAG: TVP38/TMEM64 family protein [Planctomycetota bacterium]